MEGSSSTSTHAHCVCLVELLICKKKVLIGCWWNEDVVYSDFNLIELRNWSPVQFSSGHFVSVHLNLAHCSHKKCAWWLHAEIFTSVPACDESWAIAIFEVGDCDECGRCYWGGCCTVIRFPVAVTLLTSLHRYHISLWWLRCGHSWMVLCGMWVINHSCSSFSHLLNCFFSCHFNNIRSIWNA